MPGLDEYEELQRRAEELAVRKESIQWLSSTLERIWGQPSTRGRIAMLGAIRRWRTNLAHWDRPSLDSDDKIRVGPVGALPVILGVNRRSSMRFYITQRSFHHGSTLRNFFFFYSYSGHLKCKKKNGRR